MSVHPTWPFVKTQRMETNIHYPPLLQMGVTPSTEQVNDDIHTYHGTELVHQIFRKKFTDRRQIAKIAEGEQQEQVNKHVRLRSADENGFICLLCGMAAHVGTERKSSDWIAHPVWIVAVMEELLKCCSEREDDLADTVKAGVLHVHDLPASDSVYHQRNDLFLIAIN